MCVDISKDEEFINKSSITMHFCLYDNVVFVVINYQMRAKQEEMFIVHFIRLEMS